MNELLDILKYILPSLVVFVAVYFVLISFLENDSKKRIMEIKLANQKTITPIRLQAYERIVLFLERISPNNLILRVSRKEYNAFQLQSSLIKTIRGEFEHNLSQQLYISTPAWEIVKKTKEDIIKLINTAAASVNDDANANELAKKIIEMNFKNNKAIVAPALEFIKKEVSHIF
ncbi:MAG: hypothetical protein K8S00_08920 [Bacteroidales bacterium]|nr:hypothetical protein [Bacteroidales bacterium]